MLRFVDKGSLSVSDCSSTQSNPAHELSGEFCSIIFGACGPYFVFFVCDVALSAPVTKLGKQTNLAPAVQLLEAVGESESAAALFSRWNALSGSTRANGLSEGFSRHAVWARLTLDRPMSVSENWWLVLSNPLLDHVDVYLQRSDGSVSVLSTGEEMHVSDAAAPTMLPTVSLRLETGENRILIRLEARNAIATRIAIRNDQAMLWFEHRQLFQGGLIAGTHLFAALAGFVVALALRDKVWVLFSVLCWSAACRSCFYWGFQAGWGFDQSRG